MHQKIQFRKEFADGIDSRSIREADVHLAATKRIFPIVIPTSCCESSPVATRTTCAAQRTARGSSPGSVGNSTSIVSLLPIGGRGIAGTQRSRIPARLKFSDIKTSQDDRGIESISQDPMRQIN
jgi:hypothetical protein